MRRLVGFVLGAAAGLVAGLGLVTDLPDGPGRTRDLLPAPEAWGLLHWLVVGSAFLVLGLACFVERLRWAAIGYLLGLPVLLVSALVYNQVVWGQFGLTPTIP